MACKRVQAASFFLVPLKSRRDLPKLQDTRIISHVFGFQENPVGRVSLEAKNDVAGALAQVVV